MNIRFAMYFNSRRQDAEQCGLEVRDGKAFVRSPVSNPAMSCPDMFAWKLFVDVVQQEFWKSWAADQQTWPGNTCSAPTYPGCVASAPLPLCDGTSANCCDPANDKNPGYDDPANPAKFCPYFPGDHMADFAAGMPVRVGAPPSKAHAVSFAQAASRATAGKATRLSTEAQREADPGREIRQAISELVFRNKPMFDFVFQNNLYHQEGIAAVFKRNAANITDAPYRAASQPVLDGGLAEIDFPIDAIMIKSDWMAASEAASFGLKENPRFPFIKMTITSPVTDNNGFILKPGEHWLVAFHVSSKDTPQWVWATFEHVDNPGRCDYTGCNDSFGYASPDEVAKGQETNYTRPHTKCDDLVIPSFVFDLGKPYPSGAIQPRLGDVFAGTQIATRPAAGGDPLIPSRHDQGWLSYRLKGSQVSFTDSMGRPTHLGNSVTEGGFMTSSSCISCHARAGTRENGTLPPALGVFVNQLSAEGYADSHNGIPEADWFHRSAQPPALEVLQTDFVWGFLAANSIDSKTQTTPAPASVRDRRDLR